MKRVKEKIKAIVFLLVSNPAIFFKKLYIKIRPLPKSPFKKRINGVKFEFEFDYDPAIKLMYFGVYEMDTVEAMRKILKKGDTFIDVGANIGYLSAVAMGLVGKTGEVHSFEPVPKYFHKLKNIAIANKDYNIVANQCALGDMQGIAKVSVTILPNIGWNTMVAGLMSNETVKETVEVPIYRLDNYIKEKSLDNIKLIKIDTEGFEFPVLKGLSNYFKNNRARPLIICEIAPSAYPLLGCTLAQLKNYMEKYSYHAFSLVDTNTEIDITTLENTTNVVFMSSRG